MEESPDKTVGGEKDTIAEPGPSHLLALSVLSAYGAIAFPLAGAFIALQVLVPTHYAETTALSLSTIGTIMLVARLWDTITDPLIGFLSDKNPTAFWPTKDLGRGKCSAHLSVDLFPFSSNGGHWHRLLTGVDPGHLCGGDHGNSSL